MELSLTVNQNEISTSFCYNVNAHVGFHSPYEAYMHIHSRAEDGRALYKVISDFCILLEQANIVSSKYKHVIVLPVWKAKSDVSSVGPSWERKLVFLWQRTCIRNVRSCLPYRQYTNIFIFWFISEHCLHSTQRLFKHSLNRITVSCGCSFYQTISKKVYIYTCTRLKT